MAVDLNGYAFSFSHAIITIDGRQFGGISGVSVNQSVTESFIYGTSNKPIRRAVGLLQAGRGRLTFDDYEDGADFFEFLSPAPFMRIWGLDYVLAKATGETRTIECKGSRITEWDSNHQAGSDAISVVYPFSFMEMQIDGRPFMASAAAALQLGARVGSRALGNF